MSGKQSPAVSNQKIKKIKKKAELRWGSGQTLLLIWQVAWTDRQLLVINLVSLALLLIVLPDLADCLYFIFSGITSYSISIISKSHSCATGKYSDVILSFCPKICS